MKTSNPNYPLNLSLEKRLLEPEVRRSPEALSELIADDFREIGSSGYLYTKQDVVEGLSTEEPFESRISEPAFKSFGPNMVLLTYRIEQRIRNSKKVKISLRSPIWQNTDGQWKIIFHQGTRLKY